MFVKDFKITGWKVPARGKVILEITTIIILRHGIYYALYEHFQAYIHVPAITTLIYSNLQIRSLISPGNPLWISKWMRLWLKWYFKPYPVITYLREQPHTPVRAQVRDSNYSWHAWALRCIPALSGMSFGVWLGFIKSRSMNISLVLKFSTFQDSYIAASL